MHHRLVLGGVIIEYVRWNIIMENPRILNVPLAVIAELNAKKDSKYLIDLVSLVVDGEALIFSAQRRVSEDRPEFRIVFRTTVSKMNIPVKVRIALSNGNVIQKQMQMSMDRSVLINPADNNITLMVLRPYNFDIPIDALSISILPQGGN